MQSSDNGPDLDGTRPAGDEPQEEEEEEEEEERTPPAGKEPARQREPEDVTKPSGDPEKTNPSPAPSPAPNPVPKTTVVPAAPEGRDGKKLQVKPPAKWFTPSNPLKMDMTKPVVLPLTSSELSLQCSECHIIFSDKRGKERHLKLSHPAEYEQCILRNSVFTCYVCERHFTNSTELMAHQKSHPERKPFGCPLCSQAFKRSSELTAHKKSHFEKDGYACTDCGKLCKTMTLLKYHQRTHSDDRPYVCKECGLRFRLPSTLHRHVLSHLPEGDPNRPGKKERKEGGRLISCTLCEATFRCAKTHRHHLNTKHNLRLTKHSAPVIIPINISQQSMLHVEPNGPLQKVDANIDTEQICRLIESLGNVKKVNQVVVLGQVPHNAPPLDVQQILGPKHPPNTHLGLPQIDFVGLKQMEKKSLKLDLVAQKSISLSHPLILEPITPDGQENNSFLDSWPISGDNEVLKAQSHSVLSMNPVFPIPGTISTEPIAQLLGDRGSIDLEQTVILELTPALTDELESSQNLPQQEVRETEPSGGQEKPLEERETSKLLTDDDASSVPPADSQRQSPSEDKPQSPGSEPAPQSESEPNPEEKIDSEVQENNDPERGLEKEVQRNPEPEEEKEDPKTNEETISKAKSPPKEKVQPKSDPVSTEMSLNVMSAQELVKVRKRKPNRAYFYQEYIQELVGSMRKKDFQISPKPAKRPKQSRLVVKFGPPSGAKKNKKKEPAKGKTKTLAKAKVPPMKKTDGEKKTSPATSPGKKKSPGTLVRKEEKLKEEKKKKVKKQDGVSGDTLSKSKATLKKRMLSKVVQKDPTAAKVKKKKANNPSSEPIGPHVTQESLLLLKGHMQPQLKINKLDPLKTSGSQVSDNETRIPPAEPVEGQKKGRVSKKTQKALSLLSAMQRSKQSRESLLGKPKPPRKRKSSSRVEEEGVITSKHALECHDCGENFGDLSSLQQHKTTAHVVVSPGLTYTNGNVFEGVCHLAPPKKQKKKAAQVTSPSAGWDTEPEATDDQRLSFPDLIPSPSLQIPPFDAGGADQTESLLAPISDNELDGRSPTRSSSPAADRQEDEVKEDVDLQDVDLITVGGQRETSQARGSSRTSQTTPRPQVKDEEVEVSVQTRRPGDAAPSSESDSDCRVVGDKRADEATPETEPGKASSPAVELETEEKTEETRLHEDELRSNESPGVILEKIVPAERRVDGEQHPVMPRRKKKRRIFPLSRRRDIKQEEAPEVPSRCESRDGRDISAVLVKEETTLETTLETMLETTLEPEEAPVAAESGHMRWNVEPLGPEQTPMEADESNDDCSVAAESGANQCIFYPVKQEEREMLLGSVEDEGSAAEEPSTHEREAEPAESPSDAPEQQDLRSFLLESSDAEDEDDRESEHQVDSEERILGSYLKNLENSETSSRSDRSASKDPVDYFSEYFGMDLWEEIANCTNANSPQTDVVTDREVARFVGIHVAMGTLKFPSPRLYWDDLTKIPLISDAMSWRRFLQMSRTLTLASPDQRGPKEPITSPDASETAAGSDPLRKVRPILARFHRACPSPAPKGDYAVDRHPLPLSATSSRLSLQCTTLVEFGGSLSRVSLAPDPSEDEASVEKMSPKGSMLFLCRRELSTPATLERLIAAGVHGAGRVEGERGQVGDEFVSSDGKLSLRRSQCGFILSTAGVGRRKIASLTRSFEAAQASARLNHDLRDLYRIPHAAPKRWPLAVLWYLTDAALVNSWLAYRREHAPVTLMAFRLNVSKALIFSSGSDTQDSVPPQPPPPAQEEEEAGPAPETPNPSVVQECSLPDEASRYDGAGHWPEQLDEGEGGRCRFRDCQRTSRVLCLKCCVFLCISRNHNCFLNFHSQKE